MKTLKIVVGVLISYAVVSIAQAETTYKTSGTLKTELQIMDWNGGKVTMGTLKGVVITSNSSDPALNGEGIQSCFLRVVRVKESSDVTAHCTLTDKDGDISYFSAERKQGDVSTGSGGAWQDNAVRWHWKVLWKDWIVRIHGKISQGWMANY
jgi:hypothetical protein